jgi:hypothetical protein
VPRLVDGVKCVIVDERLRSIELRAWEFVLHFARDNELRTREVGGHEAQAVHPASMIGGT